MSTDHSTYLVAATFELETGSVDQFMHELRRAAGAALSLEPGCLRYDVLELAPASGRGLLYEVYTSKSDHDFHRSTPHFIAFWKAIEGMVVRWSVDHGEIHRTNDFKSPRKG